MTILSVVQQVQRSSSSKLGIFTATSCGRARLLSTAPSERAVQCFYLCSRCAILFCDGLCLHCGYFAVGQKMSSSANSALNVLILGHSHIYWLVEHVRTGNSTGLFTDF